MRHLNNRQQALTLSRKMAARWQRIYGNRTTEKVYAYDFYSRMINK